jgi:hypothetical protein
MTLFSNDERGTITLAVLPDSPRTAMAMTESHSSPPMAEQYPRQLGEPGQQNLRRRNSQRSPFLITERKVGAEIGMHSKYEES